MSNETSAVCRKEVAQSAPPLSQQGNIVFRAYHVGWIITASFTLVALSASFWLINKHLRWYTDKKEQRYIVRLLFLVPIYAVISLASFLFWNHATPLILIRDAYEAIVLTAFFYLLLMYLSHDTEEQKKIFLKAGLSREADSLAKRKGEKVQRWVFPLGFVQWKPQDGLYFLQLMKWGVLQYCVIRPTTTLAAIILDYMGLYCEYSWGLGWGHIYIVIIISISVTVAMYCLLQLYVAVRRELAAHKPLLKLFSVKAVVFLTFWQATFLSLLIMVGIVKDTQYMTAEDITIGIGAVLETFEMMLFAFLHIRAFTYQPYHRPPGDRPSNSSPKDLPLAPTPRWRSLGHAMDFRETFREIWIGCVYMFDKMRGKEPKPDFGVRRAAVYEGAFGRERLRHGYRTQFRKTPLIEKSLEIEVERAVEIEGERQWLGYGRYELTRPWRERSEGLQEQIDKELERLGHPKANVDRDVGAGVQRIEPLPWWRSLYNRISQSGQDTWDIPKGQGHHANRHHSGRLYRHDLGDIEDHSPRSFLHPSINPSSPPRHLEHEEWGRHQLVADSDYEPNPLYPLDRYNFDGHRDYEYQRVTTDPPLFVNRQSLRGSYPVLMAPAIIPSHDDSVPNNFCSNSPPMTSPVSPNHPGELHLTGQYFGNNAPNLSAIRPCSMHQREAAANHHRPQP